MHISYNKLWKLLIDKGLKRTDLLSRAAISTTSLAKLGKGKNISTDVLIKICNALQCDVTDIMEISREAGEQHDD